MRRLLVCVALLGCNQGTVAGGNDALAGTWTAGFNGKTLDYSFSADGTLSFLIDGTTTSGTWRATGSQIVVDASEAGGKNHARVTESFYLSGNQLVMPIYSPNGAAAGVVGTWKATQQIENFDAAGAVTKTTLTETTYALAADGTAKWSVAADGVTQYSSDGAWTASGASACAMSFGVVTSSCALVDGKMGMPVLQRLTR